MEWWSKTAPPLSRARQADLQVTIAVGIEFYLRLQIGLRMQ